MKLVIQWPSPGPNAFVQFDKEGGYGLTILPKIHSQKDLDKRLELMGFSQRSKKTFYGAIAEIPFPHLKVEAVEQKLEHEQEGVKL